MKSGSNGKASEALGVVAVVVCCVCVLGVCLSIVALPLYFLVTLALDAVYVGYDALPLLIVCYAVAAVVGVKCMQGR